jgi:uncharacterized membrane protein YgaE (UPF0421/DUF939 family)
VRANGRANARVRSSRMSPADLFSRHPRLPLATKSAVAASAAWLAVQPLSGVADRYPYYAPLGAVVATGATVVSSLRTTVQSILAVVIGAVLAVATRSVPVPEVVALAFVVAAGTLLGGWRRIGAMASWVPISGLFILIIGRADPTDYPLAYIGLTALGALVGVAVNAAVPQLRLTSTRVSEADLLETLAGQLEDLAEGLEQDALLTAEQWQQRERAIEPQSERLRQVVAETTEARRINWRARRWQDLADRQFAQARALQQLSFLVEDITSLVVERENADRAQVALGPTLRPTAAAALRAMATALRSVDGASGDPGALRAADSAVQDLVRAIREMRLRTDDDLFAAGTIVTTVRRAVAALVPAELADELPTDM